MSKRQLPPDRVSSYFRAESGVLAVITVTGLLYNIGLVAGPWFEGQMTEALARILLGEGSFSAMVSLGGGVHRRHRRGTGTSVFEAVLCPPLCQQGEPPHETGSVRHAGPVGSGGLGASGRGNGADQGHFRRGRLRRGDAEIHHGGVRHRRSLGGLWPGCCCGTTGGWRCCPWSFCR